MKIAISTDNGRVSAHFGRCPSYTIVDIEDGRIVGRLEISNPGHQPGFLPRFLADKGINAIIAGGMGPRAVELFCDNNIEVFVGISGPIDEVIEDFVAGNIVSGESSCTHGEEGLEGCGH